MHEYMCIILAYQLDKIYSSNAYGYLDCGRAKVRVTVIYLEYTLLPDITSRQLSALFDNQTPISWTNDDH